MKSFKIATIGS